MRNVKKDLAGAGSLPSKYTTGGSQINEWRRRWTVSIPMITSLPQRQKNWELAGHLKKVKKIRRRGKLYSKKLNNGMVKSHKRRHKPETFKVKEHVLVRYRPQKGGNLPPKGRFVVKGTVVKKRKTNPDPCKVRFRPPNCSKHVQEWFSVEDIASITKRHPGSTNNDQQKIKQTQKKLYILFFSPVHQVTETVSTVHCASGYTVSVYTDHQKLSGKKLWSTWWTTVKVCLWSFLRPHTGQNICSRWQRMAPMGTK